MNLIATTLAVGILVTAVKPAIAGISFAPYASIKSTKSIKPGADKSETETIKQRQEYGLRASVSFWKLFKTQLSVGQSQLTTTSKISEVTDEYGDVDLQADLNMDTSQPDKEVQLTETQRVGKFSLLLDPSFSIIILRFKLGITAQQRIIEKEELGALKETITVGPTYKPHSGLGFGVRLTPRMYFMAEYEVYHYKYPPDIEPFEREVSVSYNVSI